MSFPYDRSNNPKAAITWGKDFNFYRKLTVANSNFNTDADVWITFPTYTVNFSLESTGVVQYSFNGTDIHGEMDSTKSSKDLSFQNRPVCKIWFKLISGTGTVRIEAWGLR